MKPRLKISDHEYLFMDVHQYKYVEDKKIVIGRLRRYRFLYLNDELDDIKVTDDIDIDEIKEFEKKNGLIYISIDSNQTY